jgi:hypothetical protein
VVAADISALNPSAASSVTLYEQTPDVPKNVQADKTVLCDATLQTNPNFEIVDGVLTDYHGQGGNVVIPENAGIATLFHNFFLWLDKLPYICTK